MLKDRIKKVIKLNLLLLIFGFIYILINHYFHFGFICIFHELTGLLCPGCGFTRCIIAIIQGRFFDAFNYNMLVFCLLPVFLFYYCYSIYNYIKTGNRIVKVPNYITITILVITILFGILRNLL